MTDPDNIPIFNMSTPQFTSSSNSDINEVRLQFPMNNQHIEPCSSLDPSHSFKRPRMSDNEHSTVLMDPPSRMNQTDIFFKTRLCTKFRFSSCRNGEKCSYAHGKEELRQPPPNWQELKQQQEGGNRDTSNFMNGIFFKTHLCAYFMFRSCRNGEKCSYAHGKEELRQPPPNWKELKRPQLGGNRDDYSLIHEDTAKFGKESWKTRESDAITIRTIGNNLEDSKTVTEPPRDDYSFLHEDTAKFRKDAWKTRESDAITNRTIGNNLEDNKTVTEPYRGTYWKTKICSKWKHTRSCTYGDDSNFAHGDAELQVPGGGIEANSTKAVLPTLRTTGFSAKYLPTLPASVPVVTEEEKKAKKELFLNKKINKINRIYGDWIDD